MKPPVLPFAFALAAFGLLGMVRGSALADVRVEGGGTSVTPSHGRLSSFPAHEATTPSAATYSVEAVSTSAALDWTPAYEPGRVLEAGETVQVIPVAVWRASLAIPDEYRYQLLRACWCESRWQTDVVGMAGEEGACQVMARFWGEVPTDLRGQFQQAGEIASVHGVEPWTTKGGCPDWNAE